MYPVVVSLASELNMIYLISPIGHYPIETNHFRHLTSQELELVNSTIVVDSILVILGELVNWPHHVQTLTREEKT